MVTHDNLPDGRAIAAAFEHASTLDGSERDTWLAQLTLAQPQLAAQIRAWLADDDDTDTFDVGPPLLADDLTRAHATLASGTRLGAWRIVAPLGAGGMGRVYLAERADGAFAKQVAIKVLRREHHLPAALLQRERQLLARLEHPSITRILDGGVDDDGNLYLVMERVHGEDIAQWCTQQKPSLDARLDVFMQIVDAVAHAHRELVVHGDIKPNNILIDDGGRARLLDFGIARLLSDAQNVTTPAALALTPAWAAPECCAGAAPDVRSDVHALGALLHFLLYGHPPAAIAPEPERDGKADSRTASIHKLHGDMDAIIGRATSLHPDDRYRDVVALADDVERCRNHRPVAARHGGRLYRARCFVRRHWFAVGAASTLVCVLLAATAVVAWQNTIVRAERDRATLEVARSQTVLDYLLGVLGTANQTSTAKQPASLRSLLADSLVHINSDFVGDSEARQLLISRLAELHVRLADYTTADSLLQWFARGQDTTPSPPLLRARVLDNRALVRLHQNKIEAAAADVASALNLLQPLRIDSRSQRSELLVTRAQIERRQGHLDAALTTLHKALSLRLAVSAADASQTVVVRNSLAVSLMRAGQMQAALAQFAQLEKALISSRREHSKDAADIYNNYASTSFAWGEYAQAERLFDKAMTLQSEIFGPSASLAALLNNYGKLKLARGEVDAGARLIDRANTMMARFAGADSIDAQLIRIGRGSVAEARGHFTQAAKIYTTVTTALSKALGAEHPLLSRLHALTFSARARGQQLPASDPRFDTWLTTLAASPRGNRPRAQLLCLRAELSLAQHQLALAQRSAAACVALRQSTQSPASPTLAVAHYLLAVAQHRATPDNATRTASDARWQALIEALGADHPHVQRLAELRES
ncbi:MAG: protein kinase [Xanthomonadales bacterium]|nr:protein kinase [Xanthomonadales bacterium]